MVTIHLNGQPFEFCTKWEEADPDKLINAKGFIEELMALSDATRGILNADYKQLFPLYTLISFIDEKEEIENVLLDVPVMEIETESYGQMEQCRAILKEGKLYQQLLKIARVYYPNEKDCVQLLSIGANIIVQIDLFLNNYAEMFTAKLDDQEIEAGFERMSAFGSFGTALAMSGKDLIRAGEILKQPAIDVYATLLYSFIENSCQKELIRIRTPVT